MAKLPEVLWLIEHDGSPRICGPASTDLVVRDLMAGKIHRDCRVQRVGDTTWTKLLDVDVFHDAMQTSLVQTRVQTGVAQRLGEGSLPGIALRRGRWGTWVVLAAVVLAFLYALVVKL